MPLRGIQSISGDNVNQNTIESATVMLVDDDESFIQRVRTFVERVCGVAVIDTASSAEEALQRVGECRPSVIVIDISMSGMSGLDAIAPLKAKSPSSSVIVMSSMPSAYGVKAVELGAIGYVEKDRVVEDLPPLLATLR